MRNPVIVVVIAVAVVAAGACSKSNDVSCQPGHAMCSGSCIPISTDPQNCGACGHACAQTEACVAGACTLSCRGRLRSPIEDPWGYAWDGLERIAATYLTARDTCEALGGRLPTASEIVRAGVKTATVGDTYQTSLLWSVAPVGTTTALSVRLSDGTAEVSGFAADPLPHYRCVCPPTRPAAFTGTACYATSLGAGCAALPGDPRFNLDAEDRPPLPRSAAMYECALAGGELPTAERLVAAFRGGLPNPTNAPLHTGDAISTDGLDAVVVSSAVPTFARAHDTDFRAFRCFGPAVTGAVATVAGGFREPLGDRVMDADPDHAATTYPTALFDCVARGGHLPTGNELGAFAIQGLPAGTWAGPRWTADQTSLTEVETFAWSGSAYWPLDPDPAVTVTAAGVAFDATTARRDVKSGVHPYRCIYYPVDAAFPVPPATSCGTTGCLQVSVGTRARMWLQRGAHGGTDSDTVSTAAAYCAGLGGRLPSVRDYVEAIHAGLENTTGGEAYVTSDLISDTQVRTLAWTTSPPGEPDPSPAAAPLDATRVKFVCMWTDELR